MRDFRRIEKTGDRYHLNYDKPESIGRVKAFFGNFGMMIRALSYIYTHGAEGLKEATETAVLNARYVGENLKDTYHRPYDGDCMHEVIFSHKNQTRKGVHTLDIAKRLMDYGFHAPTVSFPVAGTLMIEPTESEPKEELDRFCDALIEIRKEIMEIEQGKADREDNVLKHAPHTAAVVTADDWTRPYSRQKAAFPLGFVRDTKFWPSVSRVDNAYGDRNLMCSCLPIGEYTQQADSVPA